MEKAYKLLSKNILLAFHSILSIIKIGFLSKFSAAIPTTKNKDLIVIANGPSFQKAYANNKDIFEKKDCIVTNTFAVSEKFAEIKPRYYVWLDAFMWTSESEAVIKTHDILNSDIDWEMTLFVPNFSKGSSKIEFIKQNNKVKVITYNYVYYKGLKNLGHWFYKKNLSTPRAWNVTIISLFLGINIGHEKIVLVGADHTWHENLHMSQDNILHTKVEHFFDDTKKVKYVPFYKGGNPANGLNKAKDFFWIWSKTFEGYENVADYMEYRDVKIYNGSPDSFIDAFARIDISSLK